MRYIDSKKEPIGFRNVSKLQTKEFTEVRGYLLTLKYRGVGTGGIRHIRDGIAAPETFVVYRWCTAPLSKTVMKQDMDKKLEIPEEYQDFYLELVEHGLTAIIFKESNFWHEVYERLKSGEIYSDLDILDLDIPYFDFPYMVAESIVDFGELPEDFYKQFKGEIKVSELVYNTVKYFKNQPERLDAARVLLLLTGREKEADLIQNLIDERGMHIGSVREKPDVSFKTMMKAVEETQKFWWGSTSWAVVFAIYKKHGYGGSMYQFVDDVCDYVFEKKDIRSCTKDSVQKPMSKGRYIRDIAHWKEDGAKEREVRLGEALEKWLSEHNNVE